MSPEPKGRRPLEPVAVVTSRFPLITETFILRELIELERQGVAVVLVPLLRAATETAHREARAWNERALHSPFLDAAIVRENLRVLLCNPRRYFGTLFLALWSAKSSWNAFVGTIGIFPKSVWNGRRVRALGVRQVHAHYATHPAMAALIMARVHDGRDGDLPFSVTVHAHDLFVSQAGLDWKLRSAAFVRCISSFNQRFLRPHLSRTNPPRLPVIHCGIEPAGYRRETAPGRPARDRPARLLCVASHQPYKGLTFLVEAMERLVGSGMDVTCDLIGDGPLRQQLEAQAAAVGVGERMRFLGQRRQDEVARALTRTDLFVLPSVVAPNGQMEGIPVALMEALAAGVPVVATRVSGIPELVIHGRTGTLVEPGDAAALAAAIERVLADADGNRLRAEAGRQLVREEFELSSVVARLANELAREEATAASG